jgi:hypothetical protein
MTLIFIKLLFDRADGVGDPFVSPVIRRPSRGVCYAD